MQCQPCRRRCENYIAHQKYKKDYSTLNASERSKIDLSIKNFAEATLFLMTAGGKAAFVRQELNNDYVRGNNNYPIDITSARAYIVNYSSRSRSKINTIKTTRPKKGCS